MKRIMLLGASVAVGLLCTLSGCGAPAGDPTPPQAAASVRVEQAVKTSRQQTLSVFGTIEISPDHSRTISLPYDSVVVALRAAAGQTVRAGAPILEIRPAPAAALDQRRAAEALRFARAESARVQRLRAVNLATNADLATATQALADAESAVAELGAPLSARRSRSIVAPIAGLIVTLDAAPGVIITAGAPLFRVGDPSYLQARLGVEIENLADLREGAAASVADLQGRQTADGRVTRILRRVDPNTRLAELTVGLPATAGFLPGAPIRAHIAIGEMRDVITIPKSALVYAGASPSVFVVAGGVAHRRSVTLGAEFDDRVEVLSGLDNGAPVIIEGNATLDDGAHVAVQAATRP